MKAINSSPRDSNTFKINIKGKRCVVFLLEPEERGWIRIFKVDDSYVGIPTMDANKNWKFVKSVFLS